METEAKFIVPGEATFARLRGVDWFGPYERRGERTKSVHDRYIDTPDHRFYHKELYVRLREGKEGDILLTIKRLGAPPQGAIHARDEYQVQVLSLARTDWPNSDVRTMVEEIAGDEPLGDLVAIDQTRTVSNLYQGERAVAELSLDEVVIQTAHEPMTIYELEAELLPDGLDSDLRILERIFIDEYGLEPQPLTKFERAIRMAEKDKEKGGESALGGPKPRKGKEHKTSNNGASSLRDLATITHVGDEDVEPLLESGLAGPIVVEGAGDAGAATRNLSADRAPTIPTPTTPAADRADAAQPQATGKGKSQHPTGTRLEPTDSIDAAGRKIVSSYFEAMQENEKGAAAGEDPEALHDMRVATRRMRAVLRVLGPYLREGNPTEVRRGLRAVAQSLGSVRDLDVLIMNAEKFRENLPEEERGGLDGLVESWRSERNKARKRLIRLLESKGYDRFKKRIKAFIAEQEKKRTRGQDPTTELQPYQVRHIAPTAILTRYEAVRSFEAITSEGQEKSDNVQVDVPPTIEQLHALRISGKYLRYTLECFREALPPEAADLIRDVTRMQDQLGELHDADVAAGLIKDYIATQSKRRKKDPESTPPPALAAYLEECEAAMRRIHADFFSTWAALQRPEWRAKLALVIMA
jgi:CHAD domain-containing protein